jgi:hypothetical protein
MLRTRTATANNQIATGLERSERRNEVMGGAANAVETHKERQR